MKAYRVLSGVLFNKNRLKTAPEWGSFAQRRNPLILDLISDLWLQIIVYDTTDDDDTTETQIFSTSLFINADLIVDYSNHFRLQIVKFLIFESVAL